MSREQKEPLRFSITWRDGMYRVSVPNIVGVEVVEAAAYDALRTQLAATEQARDIATKREEHFHTVNVELVEKLTEVKRERNVAYDARRNADIYARRYEEQAESAAQERDAARAQLTDANQEITELRTVIQELVGVMESAPEDFVPQYRHFVVAPDGMVCALHHGEYTPEMFDEAWNVPAGSYKSIAGYVVTKKYLDQLRANTPPGFAMSTTEYEAVSAFYSYGATRGNHSDDGRLAGGPLTRHIQTMGSFVNRMLRHLTSDRGTARE